MSCLIPIVNSEEIDVDFSRVEFYPKEQIVEIYFWVKNRLSETIYVSAKNVYVNNKKVYDDYAIDEMEGGKGDYIKMTLYNKELNDDCSYLELKRAEFKVEIEDAEVKPLLWSNKVEILFDVEHVKYNIHIHQSDNSNHKSDMKDKKLEDIRYKMYI